MRQVFDRQINGANSTPSNGDYLDGRSRELAKEEFVKMNPTLEDQADDYIDRKIQEWKDHAGEYLLYFMDRTDSRVAVMKCWSGDLERIQREWRIVSLPTGGSTMPSLARIDH
jgi:hypothetical protein